MSLKLDDLLLKKKEAVQILDLSKSTANTKEELRRLLEKVPDFKIKIEKVERYNLQYVLNSTDCEIVQVEVTFLPGTLREEGPLMRKV